MYQDGAEGQRPLYLVQRAADECGLIQAPEASRQLCIQQIEALTACGKGLTPPEEDMFDLEPDDTAANARAVQEARPALHEVREAIVSCVRDTLYTWPADVEIGDVRAIMDPDSTVH